jgi:uncharacterized protein (DUF1501 family)
MKNIHAITRRSVLEKAWGTVTTAGVGAAVGSLFTQRATAANSNGRALVCIYLFGGNDANNMIVPLSQYTAYAAARGGLGISRDELLRVRAGARQEEFGFHPSFSELQPLFQSGTMAVVANLGGANGAPSIDPFLRYVRPGHALPGWAADAAGVTVQSDSSVLTEMRNALPDRAPVAPAAAAPTPSGPVYTEFPNPLPAHRGVTENRTTGVAMLAPGVTLSSQQRARLAPASAQEAGSLRTVFPETGLGLQLYQVAGLLKAGRKFGMTNQVFLCSLGGFATGTRQLEPHAALLKELSAAMAAFYRATEEMGIAQSVTTFTDSEYSRTLQPNKRLGTDPAWGGHQLVMGGSVLGADVYGRFPVLSLGGPDDVNGRGVFRPAQSKDQYAATLATWFGLNYPELVRAIPQITRYESPTLGFVAA